MAQEMIFFFLFFFFFDKTQSCLYVHVQIFRREKMVRTSEKMVRTSEKMVRTSEKMARTSEKMARTSKIFQGTCPGQVAEKNLIRPTTPPVDKQQTAPFHCY